MRRIHVPKYKKKRTQKVIYPNNNDEQGIENRHEISDDESAIDSMENTDYFKAFHLFQSLCEQVAFFKKRKAIREPYMYVCLSMYNIFICCGVCKYLTLQNLDIYAFESIFRDLAVIHISTNFGLYIHQGRCMPVWRSQKGQIRPVATYLFVCGH